MFTACGIMHQKSGLLVTRLRWKWYNAPKKWPAGDKVEVELVPPQPCHQQATSSVHYTTSCKQSLVLPRMGEIITRNMMS